MAKQDKSIRVKSREYKVMLDHLRFYKVDEQVSCFWSEMQHMAKQIKVEAENKLALEKQRTILFLDTPDHSFRRNGLVLRQRQEIDGDLQYTLKSRSPDRYIAAGTEIEESQDIKKIDNVKDKNKLEEDIAAPFISRFSLSNTLTFEEGAKPPFDGNPRDVGDCIDLFPVFEELKVDGHKLSKKTPVEPVNGFNFYERVFEGGTLHFHAEGDKEESVDATTAVILWSFKASSRPLVAEFSFKYKDEDKDRHYNSNMAKEAKLFFDHIQQMDWVLQGGRTKTAYAYGD